MSTIDPIALIGELRAASRSPATAAKLDALLAEVARLRERCAMARDFEIHRWPDPRTGEWLINIYRSGEGAWWVSRTDLMATTEFLHDGQWSKGQSTDFPTDDAAFAALDEALAKVTK